MGDPPQAGKIPPELSWALDVNCSGHPVLGQQNLYGEVELWRPQCIPPDPELLRPCEDTTASSRDVTPGSSHQHQPGPLQLSSSSFSLPIFGQAVYPEKLGHLSSQRVLAAPCAAHMQTWQNPPIFHPNLYFSPPAVLRNHQKPLRASPTTACDSTKNPASSSKSSSNIPGCANLLWASPGAAPHPGAGCRDLPWVPDSCGESCGHSEQRPRKGSEIPGA